MRATTIISDLALHTYSAHEFWTAYVEIEADAFFYDSIDDQLSLLIFKPDPFEYIKVLPEQ